jgi:hypothetical protein
LDLLGFGSFCFWFGVGLVSKYSASDQSKESDDSENDGCGNETFSFTSRVFGKVGKLFCDLFSGSWRNRFDIEDILAINFIDESKISLCFESSLCFFELIFESINMSLLDWIDC